MTVLLVLTTLLAFFVADFFVQRSRAARQVQLLHSAAASPFTIPAQTRLVSNHTWTRSDASGYTLIGVDELLARALGSVEEIMLPAAGSMVSPESPEIGLAARGCLLELAPPVQGHVLEVNTAVLHDPAVARDDPYGRGWLLKVHPAPGASADRYSIDRPMEWLREQRDMMKEFFLRAAAPPVSLMMQDGGDTAQGVLQSFGADVWNSFSSTFTTLRVPQTVPDSRQEQKP